MEVNFKFKKGREHMHLDESIEGSLCFGVFDEDDVQIGFGRAVTDYATMFYISDVVIDKDHQGLGLGSRLVSFIKSAEELKGLWGFLGTTAAEGFYSKQGFTRSNGFFMTLELFHYSYHLVQRRRHL